MDGETAFMWAFTLFLGSVILFCIFAGFDQANEQEKRKAECEARGGVVIAHTFQTGKGEGRTLACFDKGALK